MDEDEQKNSKTADRSSPSNGKKYRIFHRFQRDRRSKRWDKIDRFQWDSHWGHWEHDHTHWPRFAQKQRGVFFLRFFTAFALIILPILAGMAAFAYLVSRFFEEGSGMAALAWILGCSLSLALPFLSAVVALFVFRGVATPLADVMAAAEAVAQGDLNVRVPIPEQGPKDFRRLAESFNHMIAELARLDQQRRGLTADVAHELRTPLHIIQGNLEGILDGVYQPTPEQINTLLEETRTLTRLVQDLGTLSLADAGQLPLTLEALDLPEFLDDVRTSFSGQAEAAGIDLQVEVLKGQPPANPETDVSSPSMIIHADPARLNQVISNLVANALRHSREGGRITLRALPNPVGVTLQVADNGEGISVEDLPFIFDRFWKGDRSRARTSGAGSGLGLAISRRLIEAHGGRIEVESEVGSGTTFTIILPN
jgi:two-component system OmpR family sensor kinase/two-component system sensor histidine kinase BaeS